MSRNAKIIISALIAGSIAGLGALVAGGESSTSIKAALVTGVLVALKDVQSYLATPPTD